ncbi:DUF4893 domain-containing protein [Salipiger sp. IMCC34102]|uniref:DUF4893 domain-containing protein n=1 Tax=Salipiger sp. IMCC34102 TaxID=2510647 RepID=UPI0013EA99BA|nr:DUF4893 domain-containing protein [Salipiger sp. IMCC34102]
MRRAFAAALVLLAGAAQAQTLIRPEDAERLQVLSSSAGAGFLQALAGGSRGDVDHLQEVMAGTPVAPIETTLAGDWSCRMLNLGGISPLVVYAPFDCRITADEDGFVLEKTTGSQRMTGRITLRPEGMVLLGTGYVDDRAPVAYDDLPMEFETDGTLWPVVGVVEQTGPDRARILMPDPALESVFDVLDLRRTPPPPEG